MAAYQAPLSLGFSRQEYWGGLPLPSPARRLDVVNKKEIRKQVALVVRNPLANAGNVRDRDLLPGSGRYPGGGNG